MKRTTSLGFAIFLALALATSAFAQKETKEFQKQIYGKWFIDVDETKKVLQKDKKWTDKIVEKAMNQIGDMELEINSDKSLKMQFRGRETAGTWSKPEFNAKTKTLKMTFVNGGRKSDVYLEILKVKKNKRLKMARGDLPPMVFYPAKRNKEKEEGADGKRDRQKKTDKK